MLAVMLLSTLSMGAAHSWQNDSTQRDSATLESRMKFIRRISTRINSIGFFNFSGRICSNSPALDLNVIGEKKGYGVSLFAAKDLTDNYSDNNFAFVIVYKRIVASKRFTLTPNAGSVMDGLGESFGDRIFLISAFKASARLTIDETSLFANLLRTNEAKEWVNRIRFIYSHTSHMQFTLSSWHNNSVLDTSEYVSAAFQASYNRVSIADHIYLQSAVSFFVMAKNSAELPSREKNGVFLTVGLSLE